MTPSSAQLPTQWATGDLILDEYLVDGTLGQGGMGMVYLLQSRSTGTRFAVKRSKGMSAGDRRNFLAELQTWIDLPEHPNLVTCRFYRTVGDEVLIFADYVEGGSLKNWIDSGRLYEGSSTEVLERILDISIQFAWGLHCVHELGLIHQDVKPGNVMIGFDGNATIQGIKPKVTDYGLARARTTADERNAEPTDSIVVSRAGATPAYCSPEQAQGLRLTRKTDVWSWGVSVLEMFTGGVTWMSGIGAADVLDHFLQHCRVKGISVMPPAVANLIKSCFKADPAQRPANMGEIANALQQMYGDLLAKVYVISLEPLKRAEAAKAKALERRGYANAKWTAPQVWLKKAFVAMGRNPEDAESFPVPPVATRRGQIVADLALYGEVKKFCEPLVRDGKFEDSNLAEICAHKAIIHLTGGDSGAALSEYNQAIEIWERLVNQQDRSDLNERLAGTYNNKALIVAEKGRRMEAVTLFERAVEFYKQALEKKCPDNLVNDLASAYSNKALLIRDLGDKNAAINLFDQAIATLERLSTSEKQEAFADGLAMLYNNKAHTLAQLDDHHGAMALFDKAIGIWARLVYGGDRSDLSNLLAAALDNMALAMRGANEHLDAALVLCDRSIEIRERLVNQESRGELAGDLASAYRNKANLLDNFNYHRAAVFEFDRGIVILERLIKQEARYDLRKDLAMIYADKGVAVEALDDHNLAEDLFNRAIEVYECLVYREGHPELKESLATIYLRKALLMKILNRHKDLEEYRAKALAISVQYSFRKTD